MLSRGVIAIDYAQVAIILGSTQGCEVMKTGSESNIGESWKALCSTVFGVIRVFLGGEGRGGDLGM